VEEISSDFVVFFGVFSKLEDVEDVEDVDGSSFFCKIPVNFLGFLLSLVMSTPFSLLFPKIFA